MTVPRNRLRRRLALTITGLGLMAAADSAIATPPVPAAFTALLSAQGVTQPVTAWCEGRFREGRQGAFAVALKSADGGGTYVVIEPQTAIVELGKYLGQPSLDCHTHAEAARLGDALRRSSTVHGRVVPRWQTSVVCAFGDDTSATCWQYSPVDRRFVQIASGSLSPETED